MKKIKDLIEIPEIETVIKINDLYDYDQKNLQDKIYNTFILTEEVLFGVSLIIKKISQKENAGFIVKGSYGSGKSHFLAYLAAIAENAKLFRKLTSVSAEISHFQKDFFPGEILAVPVSLTSYTQDISLENAVFDALRKKLISKGLTFPVSISHKIIEDFKSFATTELSGEFLAAYKDKSVETQALLLREFLIEKNLSFTPLISRDDFYLIIQKSLQQHFPGGLLLLIDEVSEFLRARSELDVNSEDIRFLQFLGEWNLPLNCWTILSMQEDIEEISSASEQALNKIRDRFNNRIYLSTTHIKELLEKRLSIKKADSRQNIANIYAEFRDYFPTWQLSLDEFYNIYPVHPATVYYLESIANLFSKARGMVEFFYNSLHAVDAETLLPYIENDANVLITPDKVFDNFLDKIQENQATHDFIDLIYKNFVKETPLIFRPTEDENSEEIQEQLKVASALVKILILTEIAPGLKKLPIGKLAELTGKGISQLEQEANINFIRHILHKLMAQFSYIKKEDVDGKFNDVYFISPEKSVADRFDEEVNKNFNRIANVDKKAISQLIQRCANARLPLQNFHETEIVEQCNWQETARKFLVTLVIPERVTPELLKNWEQKVERGEVEYVVVLGYPVAGAENTVDLWRHIAPLAERFKQSFIYWQPKILSDKNLQLMSRYYAEQYTFQMIQSEQPGFLGGEEAAIRQRIEELKNETQAILIESYFPPRLLKFENEDLFEDIARIIIDFNQLRQRLTDRILSQLYPEHKKIKPIISEPPQASVNEVISYVNENLMRHHFAVASESMKSLIKNLVEKLYLIKVVGFDVVIDPRPEQCIFIRELLKVIEAEQPGFQSLFKKFRQSEFGCTAPQFIFVIYLLSAAGFIQLYFKNRPLKPNQATVSMIENAEQITPGEQVSPLFLKEFSKLSPLVGEIKSDSLHLKGQEKVWESLIEFKEKSEDLIRNKAVLLERFGNTLPFTRKTFVSYLQALNYLTSILSQIKRSLPSGQGIETLLNFIDSDAELRQALISLEKIRDVDHSKLQHLIFIFEYLSHPLIANIAADSELRETYQTLAEKLAGFAEGFEHYGLEALFSEFERFKSAYRERYVDYHEKLYPKEYYAELRSVSESEEYKILKHLSTIELISVKNDFLRIENIIKSGLAGFCTRDLFNELQSKPVCACQLKSAVSEEEYTEAELIKKIKAGIAEYLQAIRAKENYEKIVEFKIAANQVRDGDSSRELEYFLNMNVDTFPSLTELEKNINPHTIAALNKALSGDIIIVDKNLDDLTEALYSRKFKPAQVKQIFFNWLGEGELPDGEVYLSIKNFRESKLPSAAAELPALVVNELNKLLPGESVETSLEKIISGYLANELMALDIKILGFRLETLEATDIKNIIDLLPPDTDLLTWLSPKNQALLFDFLKPESLIVESLLQLYNRLPRAPGIRRRIIAALYKKMNTFDENEVIAELTDSATETFFTKNFLNLTLLEKTAFVTPESFVQFLPFAVEESGNFLLGQRLKRMNEQQKYLPAEFIQFFDGAIRSRLVKLENNFAEKLPGWEKERNLISGHIKKIVENAPAKFIVIDGMRADFFAILRDELAAQSGLMLVEQNYCLSRRPSDTETFYQFLDEQHLPYFKCVEREYNLAKFKNHFLGDSSAPHFYIITFLDEKIHTEKGGIADVLAEFLERLKSFLFPIFDQLKPNATFYLTSDHGFIERTDYHAKDKPRYAHGGDSLYERIVGVGKFRKI